MWLNERMRPGSVDLNIGFAIRYRGAMDLGRLERGVQRVVDRHPALRLTIGVHDGQPVQTIHPRGRLDFSREPCPGWTEDDLRDRASEFLAQPFDLVIGPLVRFLAMSRGDEDHVITVAAHHIVSDMWSMAILGREIAEAYEPVDVPDRRRPMRQETFRSFVERERHYVQSESGEEAGVYWSHGLADAPEPPHVSGGNGVHDGRVARRSVRFDAPTTSAVRTLADRCDSTLHSTVLAGYYAVLHRYTGVQDLVVGSYRANRSPRNVGTIGCFRNTLAWRVDLSDRPSFEELVRRVDEAVESARPYQRYPLEDVLEGLDSAGEDRWSQLFTSTFQWNKTSRTVDPRLVAALSVADATDSAVVGDLRVESFDLGTRRSIAELAVEVVESDEQLVATFDYAIDLFDSQMIERMAQHFRNLLSRASEDPTRTVSDLGMLTDDEFEELQVQWRSSEVERDLSRPVHALIEDRVRLHPDRVAVSGGDTSLTYGELEGRSRRLAQRLIGTGVSRGAVVGVHLERTVDLVVAVVAVLRAGAGYVALEVNAPSRRLEFVCDDAGLVAVVTTRELADRLPAVVRDPASGPAIVPVARARESGDGDEVEPLPADVSADDLAYVSYTSGSTGLPKGAWIRHGSAVNLLLAMEERPGFGAGDSMLALTDLSFDISLVELVLPLVVGGRVVLVERQASAEPSAIMDLVQSGGVTVMQATPTTWLTLLGAGWSGAHGLRIWCGGEPMQRELADRLLDRGAEVWNLYGPTETTVWSSAWRVEPDGPIMVGMPLDNTGIYVLDAEQQPLPAGVPGEVYIGGAGVAGGYLNRAELTAESFVSDPFAREPAARMYRTGDLGIRTPEGSFELLGREDDQIKIRGHRIEPGEIEAALRSIEGVDDAAVIAGSEQRLVAFVVDASDREPAELRRGLSTILPGYMIPQVFERIGELPRTSADKVDRRTLRDRPLSPAEVEYAPPNPGLESEMAKLWEEFLNVRRVGRHDDFFDLGGDSLVALRLAIEVERLSGHPFPISALIESPTLSEITRTVEAADAVRPDRTSLVPIKRSGAEQPFFYVTAFLDTPLGLTNVGSHIGDRPFYALQPQGLDHDIPAETSIEEMAAHYIEEIRTVQPMGPYAIGGHCAGTWVALEIAHQLEDAGEVVNTLVMVDSAPPGAEVKPILERARRLLRRLRYYLSTGRMRDALVWQVRLMVDLAVFRSAGGATLRRVARVRRAHAMAHRHYRGAQVDAGAAVVLSEQSALTEHMNWRERWATFVRGNVTVEVIPGAHSALTEPVPAAELGRIVGGLIPRGTDDGLPGR